MPVTELQPFQIQVAPSVLDDLRQRLRMTRWPDPMSQTDWQAGTDPGYLRELIGYWESSYDWRVQEQALNRLPQFKVEIDGLGIHFVHLRGKGPAPFPLLLTHGYPDSFFRFAKIIPMLTDPQSFGGEAADAFDVIIPTLPGYGFSDKPAEHGSIFQVGDLWATLMTQTLGYQRFGAHGGDWGGTVTEQLAHQHSDAVVGIHLTDVPFGHVMQKKPADLSPAEKRFFEHNEKWLPKEGAYATIQSSKPQSLAQGLNDSPSGLASWMVEKFYAWSDCGGNVESCFSKDELLTHVMIYWVTETIGSSFLPYYEYANAGAVAWMKEGIRNWVGSSKVPAAFALFPKDISQPPREWAERFFNVHRWTAMPRGGHFAASEQPALLAEDLRTYFRDFRI